ncbi:uncharacterized protein EV422DRAFT_521322 [Fimicolochytrium jonesii]|uniref:uncharacterized protein n=1 Tax=Fimicolochytrium jonesii TaxID=1396493 RepID=UPI0022FEBEB3|nr:uncharacterized protein EV422DRAFT_521322 [Fimicolochytrium jonesii]KAI8823528.1 hypothetical protein EV422DRAFT_521322 [Fimicolochytrium jonesii]
MPAPTKLASKKGAPTASSSDALAKESGSSNALPAIAAKSVANVNSSASSRPASAGSDASLEYEGLVLSYGDSEKIMGCVLRSDTKGADLAIRKALHLHPPPPPPKHVLSLSQAAALEIKSDRHLEDEVQRDGIFARYLVDACWFAMTKGFTNWQLSVWITVFCAAHRDFIGQLQLDKEIKGGHESTNSISMSGIESAKFCEHLFLETLVTFNYRRFQSQAFTKQEAIALIDFFTDNYLRHIDLISFVFTQSQDVNQHSAKYRVNQPDEFRRAKGGKGSFDAKPLKDAVPEERWNEFCAMEREREKAERERREQEEAEAARLKAEEEGKAAAAPAPVVDLSPAEPPISIKPLELPPPPQPNPATLFPPSLIEAAAHEAPVPIPVTQVDSTPPTSDSTSPPPSPLLSTSDIPRSKTLYPAEIAHILSATIDSHLAALSSHLEKQMDHQAAEMARILEKREKEKKAGGAVVGKVEEAKKVAAGAAGATAPRRESAAGKTKSVGEKKVAGKSAKGR